MKSKANTKAKGIAKSSLKNLLMHKAQNEENSLQRGGSVSHRRAQSDCLQSRLPITQHFGKSRPRRPVQKHRAPRDKEDIRDPNDTWDGAESEPLKHDPELQRDEEEGEDSLLCDSEEMDLLGEIFETLSSRSSHERGLLYGTRSLDLFGQDSHDYITKHGFPANPSQESLSLSISGSESLQSWNLETTDELSDLMEDSDWLSPDTSILEDEVGMKGLQEACNMGDQESEPKEVKEKQEEMNVAINGNQEETDNRNNFQEVKVEEERKKDGQEKRMSLKEDAGKESAEMREEEELKENREVEQIQTGKLVKIQEMEKETNEILKNVTREEEVRGNQEKKGYEETEYLKKLTELNPHHPGNVEEQQRQVDNLKTAVSSGPQSLTANTEPLADQEEKSEEVKKEERNMRHSPLTPKVLSAVARFQSQAHGPGFQVRSRAKELAEPSRCSNMLRSRENAQIHLPCDPKKAEENNHSEGHEDEDLPSIKVSELKKRFEA